MADNPKFRKPPHPQHWRRDVVELAALFTGVTVADTAATTVVHGHDGPVLLTVSALALLATAGFHAWWSRRNTDSPPGPDTPALDTGAAAASEESPVPGGETSLWRMRTTVREEPGSLAALCTALARHQVDILSLQTHPLGLRPGETPPLGLGPGETPPLGLGPGETPPLGLGPGETPSEPDATALGERTVDEFLLRTPGTLEPQALRRLVADAGGTETWLERADAHDLVDSPARVLQLATRTALDAAELPLALRELLGRCIIKSVPATSPLGHRTAEEVPPGGEWEEHVLRLPDPSGGAIIIERPHLPFTPTEFARARALVELDARLGHRLPHRRDALILPEGQEITVRRADTRDLEAARAMHDRCSKRTLSLRYHGPVGDADRYLGHLLSPRFGRTLAVETASGKLVALGHLLWDGEESEVALLVEDGWQQRGIGAELLRRLIDLAVEARSESVYAVTQASNTGMVAAMRGLGLPLDYQVEEGTLVVTARLAYSGRGASAHGTAEADKAGNRIPATAEQQS
jgi:GNAT superfamily N-acetyltransferase